MKGSFVIVLVLSRAELLALLLCVVLLLGVLVVVVLGEFSADFGCTLISICHGMIVLIHHRVYIAIRTNSEPFLIGFRISSPRAR
jgi:hypothetical protein